jgi:phenylalanyl-tRNA synthetase beta chain
MQISINWINELVDLQLIQIETLKNKLTLGGFEVENIFDISIKNKKETVLDITATANRSDSLSIYGITNEISALLDKPLKFSSYTNVNQIWNQKISAQSKTNLINENCSTFITLIIENLENLIVPQWISQKLQSSGVIPCNTIRDFQNYLLLETGYPFEFYDLDKIYEKINRSSFTLSIKTFDQNSILTVNANKIPISIAGTLVKKAFIASQNTKNLFIEASIFSAATIRQQSRKLGLRTDRSSRYEKSLRNRYLINSLYRLISLLRITNPKLICKIHTVTKINEKPLKPILLKYLTIQEVLGPVQKLNTFIEKNLITQYLKRLNFKFTYNKTDSTWLVKISNSRLDDITREIDIIEEIGRFYGFDNFSIHLPSIKKIGKKDSNYKIRTKITNCLLNLGLTEFMNYSFRSQIKSPKNSIKLINPLLKEYSTLRSSLLPTLIELVSENLNQKNINIEGFEYGHVFHYDRFKSFQENEYVSGIFGGSKTKLFWKEKEFALNWFEAKGKIEIFFKQLNLEIYWKKPQTFIDYELLHSYRSAQIYTKTNKLLGIFGQINPILANQFNFSSELYLFEFNIQIIKSYSQNNKLVFHKEYSLYPKVIKNLSFMIETNIAFEKIQKLLYLNGTELLSEVNLLDEFKGPSIAENSTSLCLELIFQSNKKTLETKKIEEILINLEKILIKTFKIRIRQ